MPIHELNIKLSSYQRWSGEDVLKIREAIGKAITFNAFEHDIHNWDRFLVDKTDTGYVIIDRTDESVFAEGLTHTAAYTIADSMNVSVCHTGTIKAGK